MAGLGRGLGRGLEMTTIPVMTTAVLVIQWKLLQGISRDPGIRYGELLRTPTNRLTTGPAAAATALIHSLLVTSHGRLRQPHPALVTSHGHLRQPHPMDEQLTHTVQPGGTPE